MRRKRGHSSSSLADANMAIISFNACTPVTSDYDYVVSCMSDDDAVCLAKEDMQYLHGQPLPTRKSSCQCVIRLTQKECAAWDRQRHGLVPSQLA